ncbi:AAA family ATPase [Actinophytocola sp.]|uniref:nSTAND1 domain-containing NTPase n=1 Tax=Actinophytocola sp. TaxID=1872138 RepID=UPI00389A51EA
MVQVKRRPIALLLDILLVLSGALLGLTSSFAVNYLRNVPWLANWAQQWALLLLVAILLVIVGLRIWVFVADRSEPRRIWRSDRPPYPGLDAFTAEEAGVFFGRDHEVNELMARLQLTHATISDRFVAVVGPSGVGKSSMVQAGLLPRLTMRRQPWIVVSPFAPGQHPAAGLAHALTVELGGQLPVEVVDTAVQLAAGEPLALLRFIDQIRVARRRRSAPLLIVVDQAEELVTLTAHHERVAFLRLIRDALQADVRLWVLTTLRSEFLTDFLATEFGRLFARPITIGALEQQSLFDIIERPAKAAGVTFQPAGLPHVMVKDTGSGTALPLLAYTLQKLYAQANNDKVITEQDYNRIGGVPGALIQQADKVTAELIADNPDSPILPTLLRFATVNEGEPTKRPVRRSSMSRDELRIVEAFVTARLLTSDTVVSNGVTDIVYEVAHETFFRNWSPLRQAIDASANDLQWRADLERWAQDWDRSGRQPSYLLQGDRLAVALQRTISLPIASQLPLVQEFLACSQNVDKATMRQLADVMARRALTIVETDPEHALAIALTAIDDYAPTPLATRALVTSLAHHRTTLVLVGHERMLLGVAWSPDATRLATVSADRTARIWGAADGQELTVLRGHDDWVLHVTWSPDGSRVATCSGDRTARIWDPSTGTELMVLRGHHDRVWGIAWSPDGLRIATSADDQTARVWDASTGDEVLVLRGHHNQLRAVGWSPDGRRLATVHGNGAVHVWDATTATELLVMNEEHEDWAADVVWSPNGRRIATCARDRTIRVWDAASGRQLLTLQGHGHWVSGVAWSPDGQRIASASGDRTGRIWDAVTGRELLVLRGHHDRLRGVSWAPDGQYVATSSEDRTARVWDPNTGTELITLQGHTRWVSSAAWSPDGRRLATVSKDRSTRVWEAKTGRALLELHNHEGNVSGVAWSPDGHRLATSSEDRTARVWDPHRGHQLLVLRGHQDWVWSVVWSPDGQRLATSSDDQTIRIWDATTGDELHVLRGHEDWVLGIDWSPDGQYLATGDGGGVIRIWDLNTNTTTARDAVHRGNVWELAWSPDGQRLATAPQDGAPSIWDARDGAVTTFLQGHDDAIWSVAWSPDGTRLATASHDRTARIWDAITGNEIIVAGIHTAPVTSVAWSPDGQRLATTSEDGTARIWDATITVKSLITKARSRVQRPLSDDERRALLAHRLNP